MHLQAIRQRVTAHGGESSRGAEGEGVVERIGGEKGARLGERKGSPELLYR
jgi:hypothetical protein